jgi:hypothetical protein
MQGACQTHDSGNLRIFNGLEFLASMHSASGREIGSGWNSLHPQTNRVGRNSMKGEC